MKKNLTKEQRLKYLAMSERYVIQQLLNRINELPNNNTTMWEAICVDLGPNPMVDSSNIYTAITKQAQRNISKLLRQHLNQ